MSDSTMVGNLDNLINSVGVNLFEDEIDGVIFQTNEFLTNATFQGQQGPFWWILQLCMCLGALFSIIMAAGMAYKMMVKGEIFDVFKILRVLGIAMIMCWWYPPAVTGIGGSNINWSILDGLSYVPNAVGSYTKVLYDLESTQVQGKFDEMLGYAQKRDSLVFDAKGAVDAATKGNTADAKTAVSDSQGSKAVTQEEEKLSIFGVKTTFAGAMILLDKIIMFASLVLFRVGWWATIYCQQILLGMLTIFGPIQWAFSILPKWEGAWAKWLVRYITVHFYGAMLYFVGYFYYLTRSISDRLYLYISHLQQTCTKITIKKSNESGARTYWQVGIENIDVFLFRLPSHLSLVWSCFLSNFCPRISSYFGLIIWHEAAMFDIFSNRR